MKISDERGSAIIEFIGFGLVLQISVLTFFLQSVELQNEQLAAVSLARHGLRAYVLFEIEPMVTAKDILGDFGLKLKPSFEMECNPDCLSTGSVLILSVTVGSATAESVAIR